MIFLSRQISNFSHQIKKINYFNLTQVPLFSFSEGEKTKQNQEFDQFGRKYPPRKGEYLVPSITTDAVVVRNRTSQKSKSEVLMITRKFEPHQGKLAFPGGFLDYNEEPSKGCLRELKEETGLDGLNCELITVKGEPQRDPREHIVTIFYKIDVSKDQQPIAADDASQANFYPLDILLKQKQNIAFDHYDVLLQLQQILKQRKKVKQPQQDSQTQQKQE